MHAFDWQIQVWYIVGIKLETYTTETSLIEELVPFWGENDLSHPQSKVLVHFYKGILPLLNDSPPQPLHQATANS